MSRILHALSGWGMAGSVFGPLADELAVRGIRLVVLPSPLPPGSLDALPDGADVLGWSLGALQAMAWAASRPGRSGRLVLAGATARFVAAPDWPHGLSEATVGSFREGFAIAPLRTLKRFVALQAHGESAPRERTRALEAHLLPAADEAVHAAMQAGLAMLALGDWREALRGLSGPVLLLHGRHDALMPLAAAEALAQQLGDAGVPVRLRIADSAAHALPLSCPAWCAGAIAGFLHD